MDHEKYPLFGAESLRVNTLFQMHTLGKIAVFMQTNTTLGNTPTLQTRQRHF